jgi:beta-galactosidase
MVCNTIAQSTIVLLLAFLLVLVEYQSPSLRSYDNRDGRRTSIEIYHSFPKDFVWGSATSAYQVEGGSEERGVSIWDTFCDADSQNILDGSSGLVACDHFHKMEEDVQLMKELGLQAYRFSIAWTRILPDGEVSQHGIDFYNRLIDALLEAGIVPYVTLFHWDLPQRLETKYGGWLGREIIYDFSDYARICFHHFGDRVKHWITINEPWTIAVNGYNSHVHAPGHYQNPGTETYLAAHHLLLAHARTVHIYRRDFFRQQGVIGISLCGDYRYPADSSKDTDVDAAERAMVFQMAWFADPIWFGDYPQEMKERLGVRLPPFTREEKYLLKGSSDFFGLNHYSSLMAAEPNETPTYHGYWADVFVDFSTKEKWISNAMGWSVVPDGCRDVLIWIADRYNNPMIIMTENGSAENEPDVETAINDEARRHYFETYLRASAEAIEEGVDLRGYFAWSFMDNFEWQFGYQRRFGICHVDFDSLERTPKKSALWYKDTIMANGHNIRRRETSIYA